MYKNLENELKRKGLSVNAAAAAIGISSPLSSPTLTVMQLPYL